MNSILRSYFERLHNLSKDGLKYYLYDRSEDMPFSANVTFESKDGRTFNSWGNGENTDEALGKALMELIERITFSFFSPFEFKNCLKRNIFKKYSLQKLENEFDIPIKHFHPSNTNGIAIHLNKQKAIESAMLELIERHTILYSLLYKIYPNGSLVREIDNKRCKFYYWSSPSKTFTVVGSLNVENGNYFSSASHFKLEEAVRKAFFELNSFLRLNEKKLETSNFKIIKDDIDSFNRYHRYSGDNGAIEFFENISEEIRIPELVKSRFYYCEIPQPDIFKDLYKFHCVRVIHPDVQQLFFDNWSFKNINPRLLIPGLKLPEFPHIIA